MNYCTANLSNDVLGKHRDSYVELDKQVKAGDGDVKANLEVYSAFVNHGILIINRELKRRALLICVVTTYSKLKLGINSSIATIANFCR